MSDPALSPIYNRLNGTSQYHPFSADTFADWASEAGDTVQITRNNQTYTAPVHKQTISWHGAHKVTMESTGTKDREATERTSNRKYRNSSGGLSSDKAAKRKIQYDFYSTNGMYHGRIYADDRKFETIYTKTGINDLGVNETLYSKISQQADKISLVVTEEQGENVVNRASLILAINNGTSSAHLDANEVYIGNDKSTTVINGKLNTTDLTANLIQSKIAEIPNLQANAVVVNSSSGFISCGGTITGSDIRLSSSGGGATTYSSLSGAIKDLQIVPGGTTGTYKLQMKSFASSTWEDVGTFSRATSLVSGSWGGTTYTAVPDPNGTQSVSTTVILAVEGSPNPNATVYAKIYKDQQTQGNEISTTQMTLTEDVSNKQVKLTANTLTKGVISTQATWNAGRNSVTVNSITAPAGTSSSATITATASNGATKTATISASGGGFADGGVYAYAKLGSTTVARQWISLPSSATWSHYWNGTQGVAVTCTIGGKAYNAYFEVGV